MQVGGFAADSALTFDLEAPLNRRLRPPRDRDGRSRGAPLRAVGLAVIVAAGVAAGGLVLALPRIARFGFVARFRVGRWLKEHAMPRRETIWAWVAVVLSWLLRSLATFVLLAALGFGANYALA